MSMSDRRPEWRPEVIAAEQRILTLADALVTWMRAEEWTPETVQERMVDFFTHKSNYNPAAGSDDPGIGTTKVWILDRMDRDANRLFMELLRATWELRCWKAAYGERTEVERP